MGTLYPITKPPVWAKSDEFPWQDWHDKTFKIIQPVGFRVYKAAAQAIPTAAHTVLQFDTKTGGGEAFDTHGFWDTTNYWYLPTVAGYYYFHVMGLFNFTAGGNLVENISIVKNGATFISAYQQNHFVGFVADTQQCSCIAFMNGSTDYIQFKIYQNSGAPQDINAASYASYGEGYRLNSLYGAT